MQALAVGLLLLGCIGGCAEPVTQAEPTPKPELTPELQSLVLDEVPSDIPNTTFIDFGGKAVLVGYELEPARLAAPDSSVSLKLFWRSTGDLGQGYQVFTQLLTPGGARFDIEGSNPVRSGVLGPSNWEVGKIYIDDLRFTVPKDMDAARFSILVGLRTAPVPPAKAEEPAAEAAADAAKDEQKDGKSEAEAEAKAGEFGDVLVPVISGLSDGHNAGIVASLDTGVVPGAKRERAAKDAKRGVGAKRPIRRPSQLAPGKPLAAPRPAPAK